MADGFAPACMGPDTITEGLTCCGKQPPTIHRRWQSPVVSPLLQDVHALITTLATLAAALSAVDTSVARPQAILMPLGPRAQANQHLAVRGPSIWVCQWPCPVEGER